MEFYEYKAWVNQLIKEQPEHQDILQEMCKLYVSQHYPVEWSIFQDSQLEGIPPGAELVEVKKTTVREHIPLALRLGQQPKLFNQITVANPKYSRQVDISPGSLPFELDTIMKWESPTAVRQETERLERLQKVK
jgi:hypothetical protein